MGRIYLFNLIAGLIVFIDFIINPLVIYKNPKRLGSKPIR